MANKYLPDTATSTPYFEIEQVSFCSTRTHSICCRSPPKIEAESIYPALKKVKELRQFLGLANYYCRFVADYSQVAELLHRLLTKENNFHWDSKCQNAFEELKYRLMRPLRPGIPRFQPTVSIVYGCIRFSYYRRSHEPNSGRTKLLCN